MRRSKLTILLTLLSTLCFLVSPLTTSPTIAPNPIYSSAGTYDIFNSPSFGGANVHSPLTFTISFSSRALTTNTYSFGYSIKQIDYSIVGRKVNYSLESGTKTATSVSMKFYSDTCNQFNSLTMAYIIIEPLFNLFDFQIAWIMPNSNIVNPQYFQVTLGGFGPYSSGTQTVWAALVGVDATLSGGGSDEIDLYATGSLASTTSINFKISTISPNSFYLSSVIIEVFVFDEAQLQASLRAAKFSIGELNHLASYTNSAMQSYNTIYAVRTYHTAGQSFLTYSWTLSSPSLTVASTNAFSWVGFDYLILQFIKCPSSTPYLMISTTPTCYDAAPVRYYADGYYEFQNCLYDCYQCTSNTACTTCSSLDFRTFNAGTSRCDPISGYYDNGVTVAVACSSPCKDCSSATVCTTCNPGDQLSSGTCVPISPLPPVPTPCGNGAIQTGEACDDGNTVSNDGCDASCQVESYFTCASAPSLCNINSFAPTRVSLKKSTTTNQFTLVYQLQPPSALAYSSLSWSSIVSQQSSFDVSMTGSNFDSSTGKLTLSYSYNQDLNDNTLVVAMAFPNSAPFVNIQGATISQTLNQQDSNLSMSAYPQSDYTNSRLIYAFAFALSAIALLLFIIGFFSRKIIALELITIFQVAYLSLVALERLPPTMHALGGLALSCGFALDLFHSGTVMNKFSALKLQASFIDNYNLSILFVLLSIAASLVIRIILTMKKEQSNREYLTNLQNRLRGEWVIYSLMFSLYLLVLSLGLEFISLGSMKTAGIIGLLVALSLLAATGYLLSKVSSRRKEMGEFTECFSKQKWATSHYYLLLAIERCLTATSLLLTIISSKLIIITICIIIVQIIMVSALKPYSMFGERIRPLLNLSVTGLILIFYLLMQLPSLTSLQSFSPYIVLGLLAISLCYNIYNLFKNPTKKKGVYNVSKEDEGKFLNSERVKLDLNSTFLIDHSVMPQKGDTEIPFEGFIDSEKIEELKEKLGIIKQIRSEMMPKITENQILQMQIIEEEGI